MSYNKTTWAKGDVVTSAKLNNMEDGIASIDSAQSSAFAPDITNPQGGEILIYDNTIGKWVNYDQSNDDFIITCTVTSQDFSGITDVTCKQISDAYKDHMNIKIKISENGADSYAIPYAYNVISANGRVQVLWLITYTIGNTIYLIRAFNNIVDDSDNTYSCNMFELGTLPT